MYIAASFLPSVAAHMLCLRASFLLSVAAQSLYVAKNRCHIATTMQGGASRICAATKKQSNEIYWDGLITFNVKINSRSNVK